MTPPSELLRELSKSVSTGVSLCPELTYRGPHPKEMSIPWEQALKKGQETKRPGGLRGPEHQVRKACLHWVRGLCSAPRPPPCCSVISQSHNSHGASIFQGEPSKEVSQDAALRAGPGSQKLTEALSCHRHAASPQAQGTFHVLVPFLESPKRVATAPVLLPPSPCPQPPPTTGPEHLHIHWRRSPSPKPLFSPEPITLFRASIPILFLVRE